MLDTVHTVHAVINICVGITYRRFSIKSVSEKTKSYRLKICLHFIFEQYNHDITCLAGSDGNQHVIWRQNKF